MSGLQASISVHIAKEYYFPDHTWGANYPLFHRAVGSHLDRVNNLVFATLFLLRAAVKAKDLLVYHDYRTENEDEDRRLKRLLSTLLSAKLAPASYPASDTSTPLASAMDDHARLLFPRSVDECRNGFDESVLFQVCVLVPALADPITCTRSFI